MGVISDDIYGVTQDGIPKVRVCDKGIIGIKHPTRREADREYKQSE
ncbi:hypothetical protein IQ229_21700 [Nostoc cf. edaphicum LEGE 07299]|uniref:Transposase n=1 Tax=Nostoc cf. edaphicum LEGE 07299 TaxID=2777974 RepID=A0ABR9U4A3_9NOSO|nr:hypothetical protein [Nostoc edaphicum]MBE9107448.1 hypothetical protein [Nostoc cf. edaphicum LEGE 07299]